MTDNVSSGVRGLSSPREDLDEDFFSRLTYEYAVSLLSLSIERYPRLLTRGPSSALSMLTSPAAFDGAPLWCPELARCLDSLKSDAANGAARGVGQALLNLSSGGVPGAWAMQLERPSTFHWDRFLLPAADAVEVRSDGREAEVTVRAAGAEQPVTLRRAGGARAGWHGPTLETLAHLPTSGAPVLLLAGPHLRLFELPTPDSSVPDEIAPAHVESIASCLTLLRERFPRYSLWVERVLRYLCPVESPQNSMQSGSFEGYFGFAFVTARPDPLKVAEMLIHECSHQYFALLTRLSALTDDDGRLYYSPFVRRERPADRLLLAYHAFANVESFYRDCARAGVSVRRCEDAIEQLRPDLDCVERTLVSDVRFTPEGRCVMDTLLTNRSSYELTH